MGEVAEVRGAGHPIVGGRPVVDGREQGASPRISVIMPVYNGRDFIRLSLPPLLAMQARGELLEVIVVDDGSDDGTDRLAAELGASVVSSGGRLGPGGARNKASHQARGDILWFVDADVVVHDDAARCLAQGFDQPALVAVFGSYDDQPPAQNFFSQYKNLVHHFYHQRARKEAATFWSGCGAVRRDAFLAVGGFDVVRYPYPSIEDIELGGRLIRAGGAIRLLRNMQCTHLKVWRLGNLVHTEVFRRAIPWSRLILQESGFKNDLNTSSAEQFRALLAIGLALALLALVAGLASPWWWLPIVALVVAANFDICRLFYRRRGAWFALRALLFHQVYYLYSAASFGWALLETVVQRILAWLPGRS